MELKLKRLDDMPVTLNLNAYQVRVLLEQLTDYSWQLGDDTALGISERARRHWAREQIDEVCTEVRQQTLSQQPGLKHNRPFDYEPWPTTQAAPVRRAEEAK